MSRIINYLCLSPHKTRIFRSFFIQKYRYSCDVRSDINEYSKSDASNDITIYKEHPMLTVNSERPEFSRPELWSKEYPIAASGLRQSPIDIITSKCVASNDLKPIKFQYANAYNNLILKNPLDLFGWRIEVPKEQSRDSLISNGPLTHSYRLSQFHGHWGQKCGCGSEHTIDGKRYDGELHFVHWNTNFYTSLRDALSLNLGVAVTAVFLRISSKPNAELSKISSLMSNIKHRGTKTVIKDAINLYNLLPSNKSFWTYMGSLTTPPLSESVVWIVFEEPIECTYEQIDQFRTLSYYTQSEVISQGFDCNINENYRPIQSLCDRKITYYPIHSL